MRDEIRALTAAVDGAELRPSMGTEYAHESVRAYAGRWRHYQDWCRRNGFQVGAEHVTGTTLVDYVLAQVKVFTDWIEANPRPPAEPRGRGRPRKPAPVELPEDLLRPNTVHQAVNAILYFAERAAPKVPDDREVRELVRQYRRAWTAASIPPAWTVQGRRSPKRGRRRAGSGD